MRPRGTTTHYLRTAMIGLTVLSGVTGCSAGDPQITAKAAFFSDEITGAGGKFVGAMPADENKLGGDICHTFQITGTQPAIDLSWLRALDRVVALGYTDSEARQLMTDGVAAYCPTKSSAAASALAKAPAVLPKTAVTNPAASVPAASVPAPSSAPTG